MADTSDNVVGCDPAEATKAVALKLAAEVRRMFGRAIKEDGRMADAAEPVDELCDAVVSRVLAAFAAVGAGVPLADLARVRHIKSGGLYTVLVRGAQVQTDTPLGDYAEVDVYQGDNGLTWVRPASEMAERFEQVQMATRLPLSRITGRVGV